MMNMVKRYPLMGNGSQQILLPAGAVIISAHVVQDTICLFALVDTHVRSQMLHRITVQPDECYFLQEKVPPNFYGTVFFAGGVVIYHVFGDTPQEVQ